MVKAAFDMAVRFSCEAGNDFILKAIICTADDEIQLDSTATALTVRDFSSPSSRTCKGVKWWASALFLSYLDDFLALILRFLRDDLLSVDQPRRSRGFPDKRRFSRFFRRRKPNYRRKFAKWSVHIPILAVVSNQSFSSFGGLSLS